MGGDSGGTYSMVSPLGHLYAVEGRMAMIPMWIHTSRE